MLFSETVMAASMNDTMTAFYYECVDVQTPTWSTPSVTSVLAVLLGINNSIWTRHGSFVWDGTFV